MAASPPNLPEELVEEIVLRLPPDDPASLIRASVVCKTWGSAVSHPSFRRRIHELHPTAPVLGFIHDWPDAGVPNFVPTTASAFSLAAPDRRFWRALDCRHGRAFFISEGGDSIKLLLWEPITGAQQRVPVPAFDSALTMLFPSAGVFCAADGCDHQGCHGGPFRVVMVFTLGTRPEYEDCATSACVYTSETGTWRMALSINLHWRIDFGCCPCLRVGRSLVYFLSSARVILEYDFARNELSELATPDFETKFILVPTENGGLGLLEDLGTHLRLWSWEASDRTDARWVPSRVIYLGNKLPFDALVHVVSGFAEGANVIFGHSVVGLFTIELLSGRVRKLHGGYIYGHLIPIVGFYTPVSRNLPLLNASVEERGEEEIAVDQEQHLFDNGSNAIKEGTSSTPSNVPTMSSDLDERVPPYGGAAPERTDMDAGFARDD